jgi:hypothetical protein
MMALENLIPDPSTKNLWQCRPAALELTDFTGFTTPTFISAMKVIGTRVYGMVSTARFPGKDEPFVYDILTDAFVTVTGVTNANTPTSPATTGDWSPPSMDLIGAELIVTHPGYTGGGGAFFGVMNVSNPATPTWTATNTTGTALPVPPTWVRNFNGRAWYLVNPPTAQPAAYFSDVLVATVLTAGTQILTFDDNVALTCAVGLPLSNQLGGVVQSLIVFKGVSNMYQITGDAALSTLAKNSLNVATGTLAPNTVKPTAKGLMFVAPDGVRLLDFNANVSDPIGNQGDGLTTPFIYGLVPSRMCAAFNSGIYRVQCQNSNVVGNPQQQWWLDIVRGGIWSGPHSCAAGLIEPYKGTFITTLQAAGAKLFQSDPVQTSTSTYVENSVQLGWTYQTPMLPDTDKMSEVAMLQTTIHMALSTDSVACQAFNQDGGVIQSFTIAAIGGLTIWGAFIWGAALWGASSSGLFPRPLNWSELVVFRRMGLRFVGESASGVKLGRIYMRYEVLNYLQQESLG